MSNYPTLRLGVLQGLMTLKALVDVDENYLDRNDCPYDSELVTVLKQLFEPRIVEKIKEVRVETPERGKVGRPTKGQLSDDAAAEVEVEAQALLAELTNMSKTEDGEMKQLDTKTKLDIIKVKTQLMDKLTLIRERLADVRKVAKFQAVVIGVLDDIVPEDRRDEFLKRLEPYRS